MKLEYLQISQAMTDLSTPVVNKVPGYQLQGETDLANKPQHDLSHKLAGRRRVDTMTDSNLVRWVAKLDIILVTGH